MTISGGALALTGFFLILNLNLQLSVSPPVLEPPQAPEVRLLSERTVAIDWDAVNGADRYVLQQWHPAGWVDLPNEKLDIEVEGVGPRALIRKHSPGALINTYRVRAIGCGQISDWSPESRKATANVSFHPADRPPPLSERSAAPIRFQESGTIWSGRLTVGTTDMSESAYGYAADSRIGLLTPDAFSLGRQQVNHIQIVRAQQTNSTFTLELHDPEHALDEFTLSIDGVNGSADATVSSCDSTRLQTSRGVRYLWPGIDLAWRPGSHATMSIRTHGRATSVDERQILQPAQLLTATFEDTPSHHSGEAFPLQVRYSRSIPESLTMQGLKVTGGVPISATPLDDQHTTWELLIAPDSRASVRVQLQHITSCATPAALCAQHFVRLANQPEAVIKGPPIHAEIVQSPKHHSTLGSFPVMLRLSEPIAYSGHILRDLALQTSGGSVSRVQPSADRPNLWELTVTPDDASTVEISFDPTSACQPAGAACLGDLYRLTDRLELSVPPATIHLTFDDGPNPDFTPQILDILAQHNARATFFVTGWSAVTYPELIQRIVSEGHTLANHSWDHVALDTLSKEEFDANVMRTQWALGEHATACIRPPFYRANADTYRWAEQLGLNVIIGNVRPQDWTLPGATVIAERIVDGAAHDAVVVLHDGGGDRSQTVEGLRLALEDLKGQNYAFEPLCS